MPYIGPVIQPHGKGVVNDLFHTLFTMDKVEYEHEAMSYERAVVALESGKVDCTLALVGASRKWLMGNGTILFYDLSAAHRKDTEFKGVKSLAGKSTTYSYGFNIRRLLPVEIVLRQIYDLSSGYLMLERHAVDYVLDAKQLLRLAQRSAGVHAHDFIISPIKSYPVQPAFADTENGRFCRDVYDRRIQELAAEGELEYLLRSGGIDEEMIQRVLATY